MNRSSSPRSGNIVTFIVAGDVDYAESNPSTYVRVSFSESRELFHWLGLSSTPYDFGFLELSDLRARCNRRLWPIPRNLDPSSGDRPEGFLKGKTEELLRLIERAAGVAGPEETGILYS